MSVMKRMYAQRGAQRGSSSSVRLETTGFEDAIIRLRGYGDRIFRKHARRGMTKASRIVANAAKSNVPKESGLLRMSIASKIKTYTRRNTVVGIIGPRRGYRQSVVAVGREGHRKLKRMKSQINVGGTMVGRWRDPIKYAHIVERGRKAVSVKTAKSLVSATGQWLGKSVAAAPGTRFLERAEAGTRGQALDTIARELAIGLEQEAMKRS